MLAMLRSNLHYLGAVILASLALLTSAANAEGIARIERLHSPAHVYRHVTMRLSNSTYTFRSPDRVGSLMVTTGACTYVGELQRCLPYLTKLYQDGKTHQLALEHGTVYINRGTQPARLPHSYRWIKPHEIVVHLRTLHGTYISIEGRLDSIS